MFASVRRRIRRLRSPEERERGAVLVEAALGLPLLVALAFGIITFGQAYSNASITAGATRTGARMASATYAPAQLTSSSSGSTQLGLIASAVAGDLQNLNGATPVKLWMYQANGTTGLPSSSGNLTSCSSNCISWTWNATSKSWTGPSGSWSNPDGCGSTLDYVGIYVQVTDPLNIGLFGTRTITMNQRTSMRIEPVSDVLC